MNLKEALKDWTDWDDAQYELAKCIGFIPEDATYQETKGIWWSCDGDAISGVLIHLWENGFLERREEPDIQYRWAVDDLEDFIAERAKKNPRFPAMVDAAAERMEAPDGYRICCGHLVEADEPCPFCDEGFQ